MCEKRKSWTAFDENIFLKIWYRNLEMFNIRKTRSEVYHHLETELLNHGIVMSAASIKAKMESLKRKYLKFVKRDVFFKVLN